jgi:hypothetical protein
MNAAFLLLFASRVRLFERKVVDSSDATAVRSNKFTHIRAAKVSGEQTRFILLKPHSLAALQIGIALRQLNKCRKFNLTYHSVRRRRLGTIKAAES